MGASRPEADVEIILLTDSLMKAVGLKCAIKIAHVGVLRGIFNQEKLAEKTQNAVMQPMDKRLYDDALKMVEDGGVSRKGLDVLRRLVELKGNRVFDVVAEMKETVEDYEKAIEATDNLSEILSLVSESGNNVDMTVDAGFARGLEYYTGMIFEICVPDLNIALGGGGRYDKLIELFGGEPTPAVGVAHGIDRIMLGMQEQKVLGKIEEEKTVMIIPIQEELKAEAFKIAQTLRSQDIRVEVEVMGRKMGKALEDADRRGIDYAVIVGERELKEGAVVFKKLKERQQVTVKIEDIAKTVKT
jgi:histidyl-tRNA synthetase